MNPESFTIGKSDGKNLHCDIGKLIETRMLATANSGAGKSWLLRKILEETHGKVQHIVLDLEGEFATLREKYNYLLISKDGDIPINVKAAPLLAIRLLETQVSAIIDLYELKHHERISFAKNFLDAMMNAPKELWHPVLVVVDEAHILCPEKGESEAYGSVIDLMTRGRKRGFCGLLATQRLSKLSKDAAAEANNVLIGRCALDVDMKRAAEALGFTSKEQMHSLRMLEPGEFFTYGPAILPQVTKVKVGDVKTSHPKIGNRLAGIPIPTPDKIKALVEKFKDLPQEAEKQAQDSASLRQRIRELETSLRTVKTGALSPVVDQKSIERQVVLTEQKWKKMLDEETKQGNRALMGREKVIGELNRRLNKIGEIVGQDTPATPMFFKNYAASVVQPMPDLTTFKVTPVEIPQKMEHVRLPPVQTESRLRSGAMRILGKVCMSDPTPITRNQAAILAGFTESGGTFQTYLAELKREGWITESGDRLSATQDGLEAAGEISKLPTDPQELVDMWASKFRTGAGKILRIVAKEYPRSVTKEYIGMETNFSPTGGTFNTYLSELRRAGLIEINGEEIRATPELFLETR